MIIKWFKTKKIIIASICVLVMAIIIGAIMINNNKDPNSVSGINDAPSFTRGTIRAFNRVDSEITVEISDEDASNFAGNRVLILECNPYVIGPEIFDDLFVGQRITFYYWDYKVNGNRIRIENI